MELTRYNQHEWDKAQIQANETKESKNGFMCLFTGFGEIRAFKELYPEECKDGYQPFLNTVEGKEAFNKFRGKK